MNSNVNAAEINNAQDWSFKRNKFKKNKKKTNSFLRLSYKDRST